MGFVGQISKKPYIIWAAVGQVPKGPDIEIVDKGID
jgi:hypothetical protein